MAERRVAVTGAGVVSPIGTSLDDFYRALCDSRSGLRRLPEEVAKGSGVQVAAMIDWNPAPFLKEAEAANLDRSTQFALAAASQAIAAAGLDTRAAPDRTGGYSGTGLGRATTAGGTFKDAFWPNRC